MEWLERLNQTMIYIEENLTGTIDYNHAAKIACCSTYHFRECFPTSPVYIFQNTSGEDE